MYKTNSILAAMAALAALAATDAANAQSRGRGDGSGPVGSACAGEIKAYCAGMSHGGGAVRGCLQDNRSELSRACRAALDGTGGGRGMGRGRN
jgi:hypothetical protein